MLEARESQTLGNLDEDGSVMNLHQTLVRGGLQR